MSNTTQLQTQVDAWLDVLESSVDGLVAAIGRLKEEAAQITDPDGQVEQLNCLGRKIQRLALIMVPLKALEPKVSGTEDDLDGLAKEINGLEREANEFRPDILAARARHARGAGQGLDLQEELARASKLFDSVRQFKAILEGAVAAEAESDS